MLIISILIGLAIVFGLFLINGKGYSLIAGFNAKSEEELEEYDTAAVCKFMGKIVFALAFSMVFWIPDVLWMQIFGVVLFMGINLFSLIYSKGWKRFKR